MAVGELLEAELAREGRDAPPEPDHARGLAGREQRAAHEKILDFPVGHGEGLHHGYATGGA